MKRKWVLDTLILLNPVELVVIGLALATLAVWLAIFNH